MLKLDVDSGVLEVQPFRRNELDSATDAYRSAEEVAAGRLRLDVVLVRVDTVAGLKRAYPNYFADTTAFVEAVLAEA